MPNVFNYMYSLKKLFLLSPFQSQGFGTVKLSSACFGAGGSRAIPCQPCCSQPALVCRCVGGQVRSHRACCQNRLLVLLGGKKMKLHITAATQNR